MKKPIFKKWWFWVIVVIIIGAIGSSMNNDPEQVSSSSTPTPSQSAGGSPSSVTSETPTATPTPVSVASIGDTITVREVEITLDAAEISQGVQYNAPGDGKVFLFLTFSVANNSKNEINLSSLISTDAYVDDYSTDINIMAVAASSESSLDGSVAPGKKMKGVLAYEVPEDFEIFEVSIQPDPFRSDTADFAVKNSD